MDGDDTPTFELRATLNDGSPATFGPFATHAAATERAHLLLGAQAVRIETLRRLGGRVELLGVIGRPKPRERQSDDPLTPRHTDCGII